jgi:DNA (cytosine-5)-methyltransferase 1
MRTTRPDFEHRERHFLYREYLQIVADHEPAAFVLENVKGLLTSKQGGKNIVTRILDDLAGPAKALGVARAGLHSYRLYAPALYFTLGVAVVPKQRCFRIRRRGTPEGLKCCGI